MSYTFEQDYLLKVKKGLIPGSEIVHKFGAHQVTTTIEPIALSGVYQTPTAAVALEIVSSSANDNVAGTGAHEVTVVGLDASWNEITQTVIPNGVSAVAITTPLIRLTRLYVSSSGTYATQSTGSHTGTLTVRAVSGSATWAIIDLLTTSSFPAGQSQIGCYTVPNGKIAHLLSKFIYVDATKNIDIFFFQRPNADDVASPYSGAMRLVEQEIGITSNIAVTPQGPLSSFTGPCDIGFLGLIGTGTGYASVDFELLVEDA